MHSHSRERGFTLIELSIVLVVIGLVVAGILVGRDLISAAGVRAQIAQIDMFGRAVNSFREKFGYLPGDIPDPDATRFGFMARGQYKGEGDGNGIIDGIWQHSATGSYGIGQGAGETIMVWRDLSTARMIEGSFTRASPYGMVGGPVSGSMLGAYLPEAKLGNGNYVYVWNAANTAASIPRGFNFFGLSRVTGISVACTSCPTTLAGLSVREAYNIDAKVDDGKPITGNALAIIINQTSGGTDDWAGTASSSVAAAGSSTTCYDNNNSTANPVTYSLTQNNGNGVNCGVSFKFQ